MAQRAGVIGLGTMGSGIAANIIKAGFATTGYDITDDRLTAFAAAGGTPAADAGAVTAAADVVVLALPTQAAYDAVIDDDAGGGAKGLVIVDICTFPIPVKEAARDRLAARGIVLLDAPVSGAGKQAAAAELAMMCSGDEDAYATATPVIAVFTRSCHFLGAFGTSMKYKLIVNLMIHCHNMVTAEALLLARKAGLELDEVIEVIGASAANSRVFGTRAPVMASGVFDDPATLTAELAIAIKDNDFVDQFAADCGCPTPMFDAARPFYAAAAAAGLAHHDAAVLFAVAEAAADDR